MSSSCHPVLPQLAICLFHVPFWTTALDPLCFRLLLAGGYISCGPGLSPICPPICLQSRNSSRDPVSFLRDPVAQAISSQVDGFTSWKSWKTTTSSPLQLESLPTSMFFLGKDFRIDCLQDLFRYSGPVILEPHLFRSVFSTPKLVENNESSETRLGA